jgi:hypothetical protein
MKSEPFLAVRMQPAEQRLVRAASRTAGLPMATLARKAILAAATATLVAAEKATLATLGGADVDD